jgi:restriction endonuclease S subunit
MSTSLIQQRFRTLEELADIAGGVALGGADPGGSGTELPYLRVANVQDGYISTDDVKTVRVASASVERFRLRAGDVLLTEGGDFDKLGRGGVWDGRIDPCLHQNHVFRVRCDTAELIPEFLSLYMASRAGRSFFLRIAKQTTNLATISSSQLKSMPVPVVPVAIQRRIVEVIRSFTELERYLEASIAKLEALRFGVMEELTELECGQFGEVLKQGPQNGIYKPAGSYGLQGTPIVRIDSFSRGRSDLTRGLLRVAASGGEVARYRLDVGDIVINRVNTPDLVGKSTSVRRLIEPTIFESNMMRCKLNRSVADPVFTETWLASSTVKRYFLARAKSAISQASINGDDVRNCPFPKIDVHGQLAFLERLDAVEGQRLAEVAELAKLHQLKQGLVDDLLSGRLSVSAVVV